MIRSRRARSTLLLVIAAASLGVATPAFGGGSDPGTFWEKVGGEFVKRYEPMTVDDDPSSKPSDWQRRLPVGDTLPQVDLVGIEIGRVQVDDSLIRQIPLAGLSTLPTDPAVIGPAGVTLDPARYRDVMQVDLLLGGPLDQLPPGQGIGLAVLRTVSGQSAFNAPGTQFHQASVAERYLSGQGIQRLAVNPASGRFEPTASDTLLFLDGNHARFWIPWPAVVGTTALQGHTFVPNTQIADTSSGEPGAGAVLTNLDTAQLTAARLAPAAVDVGREPGGNGAVATTTSSGGTSPFVWLLVFGLALVVIALGLWFLPMLLASPGGTVVADDPRDAPAPRRRRKGRRREAPTIIDPPAQEIGGIVDTSAASVLQYAGEPIVVGDILTAAGSTTPTRDREPPPVSLQAAETAEIPAGFPLEEVLPGPPASLVTGDTALDVPRVVPCEPERVAWTTAERACEQARFDAAAAEADATDAQAALDRMREEYPPLDWEGTGALEATMDTGEQVTDLDIRLGDFAERRAGAPSRPPGAERAERSRQSREDGRREYEDAQSKAQPLRDRIRAAEEARERAAEACARAAAARRAYDQCMGVWSQRGLEAPPAGPTPPHAPDGGAIPTNAPPTGTTQAGTTQAGTTQAGTTQAGTRTRTYEPPRVVSPPTSPGAGGTLVPPQGGCTQDLVTEVCPRQKFTVGRMLHLELRGGLYKGSWEAAAPDFARWARALGYDVSEVGAFSTGQGAMEIAGEDVPRLTGPAFWGSFQSAAVEITAWVRFEEVTMACERTRPCVDGQYGPAVTTTRRVRHQRYTGNPSTLGDGTTAIDRNALARFVREMWKEYGAGQRALTEWVARCR